MVPPGGEKGDHKTVLRTSYLLRGLRQSTVERLEIIPASRNASGLPPISRNAVLQPLHVRRYQGGTGHVKDKKLPRYLFSGHENRRPRREDPRFPRTSPDYRTRRDVSPARLVPRGQSRSGHARRNVIHAAEVGPSPTYPSSAARARRLASCNMRRYRFMRNGNPTTVASDPMTRNVAIPMPKYRAIVSTFGERLTDPT